MPYIYLFRYIHVRKYIPIALFMIVVGRRCAAAAAAAAAATLPP
jgi:hypothetical protein